MSHHDVVLALAFLARAVYNEFWDCTLRSVNRWQKDGNVLKDKELLSLDALIIHNHVFQ